MIEGGSGCSVPWDIVHPTEWSGKRGSHFDHWEMRVPIEKCSAEKRMSSRVCHDHIQPWPAKHGDGVGSHRDERSKRIAVRLAVSLSLMRPSAT